MIISIVNCSSRSADIAQGSPEDIDVLEGHQYFIPLADYALINTSYRTALSLCVLNNKSAPRNQQSSKAQSQHKLSHVCQASQCCTLFHLLEQTVLLTQSIFAVLFQSGL